MTGLVGRACATLLALSVLGVGFVVGCSSDETSSAAALSGDDDTPRAGDDVLDDAGTTAPILPAREAGASACSSLSAPTNDVVPTSDVGTAPAPTGGVIVDGTYALKAHVVYASAVAKPSLSTANGAYRFSGSSVELASRGAGVSGDQVYRFTSSAGVDAQHLLLTCECGDPAKCPASSIEVGYSVRESGGELWIYQPGTAVVQVYALQP